ncbi:MAG: hypothetical protein WC989_09020 [Micavibrio sp.]
MKKLLLIAGCMSALALGACVSQQQADARLAKGCEAATGAMLEPRTIKDVRGFTAEEDRSEGSIHRRIKLTYVENDDFAESEHVSECLFSQQWGFFKTAHAALLEQLIVNGQLVGKKGGVIVGSMDDFLKLSGHAESAMGQ